MSDDQPTPPEGEGQGQGGGQGQGRGTHVRVQVSDDAKRGEYANFLVVSHSPHDFTLDFCQLVPSNEPGEVTAEVVSRVRIPPTLVGRVIQALNTNLTTFEDRYGQVRVVG